MVTVRCQVCGRQHQLDEAMIALQGGTMLCLDCQQPINISAASVPEDLNQDAAKTHMPGQTPMTPDAAAGKILVVCQACGKSYQVAKDKIPPRGAKIRCRGCQAEIVIRPPSVGPSGFNMSSLPKLAASSATSAQTAETAAQAGFIPQDAAQTHMPVQAPNLASPKAPDDKVVVVCPTCGKNYQLAAAKIPTKGAKLTCRGCQTAIIIPPPATPAAAPVQAPVSMPPEAPQPGQFSPAAPSLASPPDKITVVCPTCRKEYLIDPAKIPPKGGRMTCRSCQTAMVITLPPPVSQPPQASAPQPAPAASAVSPNRLDGDRVSVPCPACRKVYLIDPVKLPPQGGKIRCRNCQAAIALPPTAAGLGGWQGEVMAAGINLPPEAMAPSGGVPVGGGAVLASGKKGKVKPGKARKEKTNKGAGKAKYNLLPGPVDLDTLVVPDSAKAQKAHLTLRKNSNLRFIDQAFLPFFLLKTVLDVMGGEAADIIPISSTYFNIFIYLSLASAILGLIWDRSMIRSIGVAPVNPIWLIINPVYMFKRFRLFGGLGIYGLAVVGLSVLVYLGVLALCAWLAMPFVL